MLHAASPEVAFRLRALSVEITAVKRKMAEARLASRYDAEASESTPWEEQQAASRKTRKTRIPSLSEVVEGAKRRSSITKLLRPTPSTLSKYDVQPPPSSEPSQLEA